MIADVALQVRKRVRLRKGKGWRLDSLSTTYMLSTVFFPECASIAATHLHCQHERSCCLWNWREPVIVGSCDVVGTVCRRTVVRWSLTQSLLCPQPTRSSSESICSRPGSSIPGSPGHTIYVSTATFCPRTNRGLQ